MLHKGCFLTQGTGTFHQRAVSSINRHERNLFATNKKKEHDKCSVVIIRSQRLDCRIKHILGRQDNDDYWTSEMTATWKKIVVWWNRHDDWANENEGWHSKLLGYLSQKIPQLSRWSSSNVSSFEEKMSRPRSRTTNSNETSVGKNQSR